jgi:general secretion pathway protein I
MAGSRSMNDARGFTLVELLVALAILAVALGVLLGAISDSLDRVRRDRSDGTALALAQSLLDRAGTERPLVPGISEGDAAEGFHWSLDVTSYGSSADSKAWGITAYLVRATVRWKDGATLRARSLLALRLVPPKART